MRLMALRFPRCRTPGVLRGTLYSEDSSCVSGQRRVSAVSFECAVGFVEPVTASTIGPGGALDGVGVD